MESNTFNFASLPQSEVVWLSYITEFSLRGLFDSPNHVDFFFNMLENRDVCVTDEQPREGVGKMKLVLCETVGTVVERKND